MPQLAAAIQSLRENWRRALLSSLGVAIGSIAILLLVSIGQGVENDISAQVGDLGTDVLIVVPGKVDFNNFNPNLGGKSFLSGQNAQDLKELDGIKQVAQWSFAGGGISGGKGEAYPIIIASTAEWFNMFQFQVREGNVFSAAQHNENVAVIGSLAADVMFPDETAIGKTVTINKRPYKVVGVLEEGNREQNLFSAQSLQNVVYIPLPYVQSKEENVQIDRLFAQFDQRLEPEALIEQMKATLAKRLDEAQYDVFTQKDLLKLIYQVMSILNTLVVGLTSISLFVAGFGIMTVMLMSVGERIKEIGVRKATGATGRDIFRQFLAEAVIISVVGVMVGLAMSAVIIVGIDQFTAISPLLTWQTVLMTFTVGVGIGALFGVLPARRASRLDPVVALRSE